MTFRSFARQFRGGVFMLGARPKKAAGIVSLATLIIAANASGAAAQIANGNFEAPVVSGLYSTVQATGQIGAWTVTHGSVNHGKAPGQTTCATSNGQCVDLNGGAPGGIIQKINLTCEKPRWRVDWMMSRHLQLKEAALEAFVGNASQGTFTHNTAGVSATDGKWQAKSFTFVATAPTAELKFVSKVATGAAGPQIDNVTLSFVGCGR